MSEENEESLTEVKSSLENVLNNVGSLKNEINTVNQRLNDLNSIIQSFEEKFSKFDGTEVVLNELKSSIQELNPLSNDIQGIKQTISDLQESFADQKTKQGELVEPLNAAIEGAQSKISAVEENLSKIMEAEKVIEELRNSIQELTESFSQQEPKFNEIQTRMENFSPAIDSLKSTYEKNSEFIHKIEDDFSHYKGQLDEKFDQLLTEKDSIKQAEAEFQMFDVLSNRVTSLEKTLEETKTNVTNMASKMEETNTNVTNMASKMEETNTNVTNITSKMEETNTNVTNITSKMEETNTNVTNMASGLEEIKNTMAEMASQIEKATTSGSGVLNRIKNLEKKAGILTGDLVDKGFDNLAMFRNLVSDVLGEDKVDHHIPEESGRDPIMVVKALMGIIHDLSFIDETNSLNTAEILLKYSETSDGRADRKTLIVNFANDVRRLLEVGQSVLMDIGQKRTQTRNIIEEIRNIARHWENEDDLRGEAGVFTALDLLEDLTKIFSE